MASSSNTVFIAGGSGFLGSTLNEYLTNTGYSVEILPRDIYQKNPEKLAEIINASYAVINLAGASISKRWTKKYKAELKYSRIQSTQTIVAAIEMAEIKPKVLLSASATGIYSESDESHHESSNSFADDFLGQLAQEWENEALKASKHTKVRIIRLGVILGKNGGMVKKLKPLFKWMLGGRMGSGKQAFAYVHTEDVCRACVHILKSESDQKLYNIVAPELTDNKTFTKTFAKACNRKALFIIPSFALKLFLGEGSIIILSGQKVVPAALQKEGFTFRYPDISSVLANICK
ncbi:MAG: TIGR01777 family protein [Marinilabiliales bacterium]|nr:MAG: TIGR01777 family protein [Marinilabiliales bacterium]